MNTVLTWRHALCCCSEIDLHLILRSKTASVKKIIEVDTLQIRTETTSSNKKENNNEKKIYSVHYSFLHQ